MNMLSFFQMLINYISYRWQNTVIEASHSVFWHISIFQNHWDSQLQVNSQTALHYFMLDPQIISHLSLQTSARQTRSHPVSSCFLCSAIMFIRFHFVVVLDMHKSNLCVLSGAQNIFFKLGKSKKRGKALCELHFLSLWVGAAEVSGSRTLCVTVKKKNRDSLSSMRMAP